MQIYLQCIEIHTARSIQVHDLNKLEGKFPGRQRAFERNFERLGLQVNRQNMQ
jgi:hypothetical protein